MFTKNTVHIEDYLVIIILFLFSENIEFDYGDHFCVVVDDMFMICWYSYQVDDTDVNMSFLNYADDLATLTDDVQWAKTSRRGVSQELKCSLYCTSAKWGHKKERESDSFKTSIPGNNHKKANWMD